MRLHILVEGPSEAALLQGWLPRFLPPQHSFKVIQHRGKGRLSGDPEKPPDPKREGLLDQLPAKLRAYGRILNPATERVLVLVDLDQDDCGDLKARLLRVLDSCDPKPVVLFRIAIEETEAFYLGDPSSIRNAFPEAKLRRLKTYTQDSICGTWERFQEVIGARVEDKPGWAERMADWLGVVWKGPQANRSPSFCQFCKGLLWLAGEPVD
ncbi:MAG TPA: hypothetical protein VIA62_06365 [Thermoanaerobaculia bacterium]|nr:hypothetical protein [Thermoanaerobaculia bacterium]